MSADRTHVLTGSAVDLYALTAVTRAARIRATYGVSPMRGLTLRAIQRGYGVKARTFAQAADQLEALLEERRATFEAAAEYDRAALDAGLARVGADLDELEQRQR